MSTLAEMLATAPEVELAAVRLYHELHALPISELPAAIESRQAEIDAALNELGEHVRQSCNLHHRLAGLPPVPARDVPVGI